MTTFVTFWWRLVIVVWLLFVTVSVFFLRINVLIIIETGTPRCSHRLCSDGHYSDNPQSGRRHRVADCSWIGLRAVQIGPYRLHIRRTKSRKSGVGGSTIVLEPCRYVVTFPEEGAPQTSPEYRPHSSGPTPLGHLAAWINDVLSMHATPRPPPIFSKFLLFLHILSVLKMYWVILTVDCRNSVCRNRVCRNGVCLPIETRIFRLLPDLNLQSVSSKLSECSALACENALEFM